LFPTLLWVESSNLYYKSQIKQTLDQHIESGSLSSEINSSASQVDSLQAIITSPGNANAVAAAALENKDLPFLVAKLGSDSHQSNINNNSDGDDRQFYPLLPFNHSTLKEKSWTIKKMNREMGAAVWATRIWDNSQISFRKVAENMPSCAYIASMLGKNA